MRPQDAAALVGDPSRAEAELGWKRTVGFDEMVERMVKQDLELLA